ncbi:MAG: hypothetical protein WDO18_09365 [Acidobacteriota bacterium]
MHAATYLARKTGHLSEGDAQAIHEVVAKYGPIPALNGIDGERLAARLKSDKKTVQGQHLHFVLPVKIGDVAIVSGVQENLVREAIDMALAGVAAGAR